MHRITGSTYTILVIDQIVQKKYTITYPKAKNRLFQGAPNHRLHLKTRDNSSPKATSNADTKVMGTLVTKTIVPRL